MRWFESNVDNKKYNLLSSENNLEMFDEIFIDTIILRFTIFILKMNLKIFEISKIKTTIFFKNLYLNSNYNKN